MRALTANATAEKNKTATAPVTLLKVEWGGAIGTKWYSDQALSTPVVAEARVTRWGSLTGSLRDGDPVTPIGDFSITLADTDHTIAGYLETTTAERKRVTVYQHFVGLLVVDLVPLMVGMLNTPLRWAEDQQSVELDITDLSTTYDKTLGTVAERGTFPKVSETSENSILPIVYGKVKRSKCAHVLSGAKSRLTRQMSISDTTAYVDDGSKFPQDTPITVQIGFEEMVGTMHENVFTVTERARLVAQTLTTALAPEIFHIVCGNLGLPDESIRGKWVEVYVTKTPPLVSCWETRLIMSYNSANGWILMNFPLQAVAGSFWMVPSNVPVRIKSPLMVHEVGEDVVEVVSDYVWIANDRPSKKVTLVEGWGVLRNSKTTGSEVVENEKETFVSLNSAFYEVNLNDSTTFPALGHAVTTIKMKSLPTGIPDALYRNDDLWVDIDGVDEWGDGSGAVLQNPVDILEDIITNYLGLTLGTDTNSASFTSAKVNATYLKMGFALTEQRNAIDLLGDICFQARMALHWEAGVAKLRWLENTPGTVTATVNANAYELDTYSKTHGSYDALATEVTATWNEGGEPRTLSVTDTAAETAFGRRVREMNLWAYAQESYVEHIANFWLRRLSKVCDVVNLTTFLNTLQFERGDWVEVNIPAYMAAAIKARILSVTHVPGSGLDGTPDRIEYGLQLATVGGCATTCEMACETGACESACEDFCQTGCETACESADCESAGCMTGCQIYCTTQCENVCQTGCEYSCQVSCTSGCQGDCEGTCETGCETDCQAGCETGCQTSCEVTCQTGCQTSCELSCETGCELDCETGCQTGCEVTCETGCQSACESECETKCQSACETAACEFTCESDCTVGCTTGCTGDCEVTGTETCGTICETAACQTGCQTPCETACQTSACEWSCQSQCQTQCEDLCQSSEESNCSEACMAACQGGTGGCQSICEAYCESTTCETGCTVACQTGTCESGNCQVGCEQHCETGCETSGCETAACETTCQYYCQLYCTTGCESACQTSCESGCTMACETGCQGMCETTCQTGCEMACQSACESACQTACELGCAAACELACQTGCEVTCETGCTGGCQIGCEVTCETGCETSCETSACESACQLSCQVSCQTGCEALCQTGCEQSCQTGCQTSCETGCETSCETGCETGCESACETACEIICENSACETASCQRACEVYGCEHFCQAGCQPSCQTSCEAMCETASEWNCGGLSCEFACAVKCEIACQNVCVYACEGACEDLACESLCETNCESRCQNKCESSCETENCETSCEMYCATQCMTPCEYACQAGCEAGCETLCEGTCEVYCELGSCTAWGCLLTCQFGCQEQACETMPETACQTQCELSCQETCELAAQ